MVLKRKRGGEFVDWTPSSQASINVAGPQSVAQDAGSSPGRKTRTNPPRSTRSTTSEAGESPPKAGPVKKPRAPRAKRAPTATQAATTLVATAGASLSAAQIAPPKRGRGKKAASAAEPNDSQPENGGEIVQHQKNDWKHDAEYVRKISESLQLPPFQSSPSASMAIQRELKAMLKEQETAPSLKDLGWYMPPELIGDNLYQWIVEMHSLDPALPIAKDLKKKNVNSIIFEIRFPPTYPTSPPFFRIITPRFLPFINGGGGHVTGGGSICIDLLTSDGWIPSYCISALLLQIRLAIGNLEPRPARLASNWNMPYSVHESLVGFRRAAATHNWTVPQGLDRLVR